MKTSELIGPALDWAVATCEGDEYRYMKSTGGDYNGKWWWETRRYSTDWSQGGPIIEREGIYLRAIRKQGHALDGVWLAAPSDSNTGSMVQWVKRSDWKGHYFVGPTALVAAMRAFVASRLGDEVEIPEELK